MKCHVRSLIKAQHVRPMVDSRLVIHVCPIWCGSSPMLPEKRAFLAQRRKGRLSSPFRFQVCDRKNFKILARCFVSEWQHQEAGLSWRCGKIDKYITRNPKMNGKLRRGTYQATDSFSGIAQQQDSASRVWNLWFQFTHCFALWTTNSYEQE